MSLLGATMITTPIRNPLSILFVLDALVDGQQDLERSVGGAKQRPVLEARPAGVADCLYLMPGEFSLETLWNAFIEQDAHYSRRASDARGHDGQCPIQRRKVVKELARRSAASAGLVPDSGVRTFPGDDTIRMRIPLGTLDARTNLGIDPKGERILTTCSRVAPDGAPRQRGGASPVGALLAPSTGGAGRRQAPPESLRLKANRSSLRLPEA